MRPFRIRPALPADAPAIRACAEAAYGGYVAAIGRRPAPMDADFAGQIRAGQVHVAVDGADRLLGYVVFFASGAQMHLEAVAVLPACVGRGIGKALIGCCESAARLLGLRAVALYTNAKMAENLAIYPHLGFAETGRRVEDGFDRVYFSKDLTA